MASTVPNAGSSGSVNPAAFAPTILTPRFQHRKAITDAAMAT